MTDCALLPAADRAAFAFTFEAVRTPTRDTTAMMTGPHVVMKSPSVWRLTSMGGMVRLLRGRQDFVLEHGLLIDVAHAVNSVSMVRIATPVAHVSRVSSRCTFQVRVTSSPTARSKSLPPSQASARWC